MEDSLVEYGGTLAVIIICIILFVREIKPLFLKSNKGCEVPGNPGNPVVQDDLKDMLGRMFAHQEKQDEKVNERIEKQTDVLRDISTSQVKISETQTKMCDCLDKIERGLNGHS